MEYYQCPVSIFIDDPEISMIYNMITVSLDSGIPLAGKCLLDQTKRFFEIASIIRSEESDCQKEIDKIKGSKAKKNSNVSAPNAMPRRR